MHAVHHSDSFILNVQPSGEANARVWLFTREFGLVVAMVQGVRKAGAKLQMQLSPYSLVSADLVRGRDVWRLVSVRELQNPFIGKKVQKLARGFARTLSAVERFCHGEEANDVLFGHLLDCLEALSHEDLDERAFDTVSLWKVMASLGYISVEEKESALFAMPFLEAVQSIDTSTRTQLIKETNNTIAQTHL